MWDDVQTACDNELNKNIIKIYILSFYEHEFIEKHFKKTSSKGRDLTDSDNKIHITFLEEVYDLFFN